MAVESQLSSEKIIISNNRPLVSVLCICRNAYATIQRCIDSILSQEYPHIEVIVHDCSSTDGTVDILQSYGKHIDLVLEQDKETIDGMYNAIQRSKGDIFIICQADKELLPSAISWGVEQLNCHTDAGAIYGDHYVPDIEGNITSIEKPVKWNYKQLLCSEIIPPLCTSFIRRSAYDSIGPIDNTEFGEFEMWILLGLKFPVLYVSGLVAKYAVQKERLSMHIKALEKQAARKIRVLERFFGRPDLPLGYDKYKDDVLASIYTWIVNGYCNIKAWEHACSAFHVAHTKESNLDRLHYAGMRLLNHGLRLIKECRIPEARVFIELPLKMPNAFMYIDLNPVRRIYDHFFPVKNSNNHLN
jgi:glycosyltransferase involved in cell wall biosynthesis